MDLSSRGSCVFYLYIIHMCLCTHTCTQLSFLVFRFTMEQGKLCPELATVCELTLVNSDPELGPWSAPPLCDFFGIEMRGPLLYKERWTVKKRIYPPGLQNLSLLGALLAVEDTWERQITNPGDQRTQRHCLVNPPGLVQNCVWSIPDRWAVLTLRAQAFLYTAILTSVVLTLKKEILILLQSAIYSQSGSKIM